MSEPYLRTKETEIQACQLCTMLVAHGYVTRQYVVTR